MTTILTVEQQRATLYWPSIAGIPIIPANTRNKEIWQKCWPKIDFTGVNFDRELAAGKYDNGIAIRAGWTISGKYCVVVIDFDGEDAVLAWFGTWEKVLEVSKRTRIEWHCDKWRLHMFLLADRPIVNKRILVKNSLLEIKCEHQAIFVSPSVHKDGNPYVALATEEITIISENQLLRLESKIDSLCDGYVSDANKQAYVKLLEDPDYYTKLGIGQGRHNGLVTLGTSYYYRYNGDWKPYTDEQRKAKLWDWNMKLAVPKSRKEFDDIWEWIVDKHQLKRDQQHKELDDKELEIGKGGNGVSVSRVSANTQMGKDKTWICSVYKYSKGVPLTEEIILGNEGVFLQVIDNKPILSTELDLSKTQHISVKPRQHGTNGGASAVLPIKFINTDEIQYFINQASKESIDSLYQRHKSLWKKLVVTQNDNEITFLAIDSIYSHFQDLFETTHYDLIYGVPGSGKGAKLIAFLLLGYRVVLAADYSGANILDLYGSAEIGQITIAEDEMDDILKDSDKRKIYKIGYDFTGTTMRTLDGNTSNRNLRLYKVFGLKIFGTESTPDDKKLGGFNDRTFRLPSIKGKSEFVPKKVLKYIQEEIPPERQLSKYRHIVEEINFTRKLTLLFRMVHHDDLIEEVEMNIDGRPLELVGPQINLFASAKLGSAYMSVSKEERKNTLLEKEILPTLSVFLGQKGQIARKTIESEVYEAVKKIMSNHDLKVNVDVTGKQVRPLTISYDDIYDKVKEKTGGIASTNLNEQAFYSSDYGKITHRRILKICRERFLAQDTRISRGDEKLKALSFDVEIVDRVGKAFEVITKIEILEPSEQAIET